MRRRLASPIRFLMPVFLAGILAAGASDPAPRLKLKDLDGATQSLSQYRGKIVVLNFWATWCGPCQEEMPMIVQEEQVYRSRSVVFIGVSLDEEE